MLKLGVVTIMKKFKNFQHFLILPASFAIIIMEKINTKILKVFCYAALLLLMSFSIIFISIPYLASQFGVSTYAAKKIIDIAAGAASIPAIIAVVGGSAGWGAILLAGARYAIKKVGRRMAAAW